MLQSIAPFEPAVSASFEIHVFSLLFTNHTARTFETNLSLSVFKTLRSIVQLISDILLQVPNTRKSSVQLYSLQDFLMGQKGEGT